VRADDLFDLGQRHRPEEDDVVHAVEELGPEVAPQLTHHGVARRLGDFADGVIPSSRWC
jgi:hypothetical protein